jgi:thiamine biosynthesis lipoprotein
MGSPCALHLDAPEQNAAERVFAEVQAEVARLERKYTRYRDDSLTARINRSAGDPAGIEVDDETAALLDYAETAYAASEGRFDLSSGILRRAWDFRSGRLPLRAEIAALLPRVGWRRVRWRRPLLVLPREGMELDFGGLVKEYAADRAALLCRQRGAPAALVDLGGDLAVAGPHADGRPWRVGVRDPFGGERPVATLSVYAGGVATSGDTERCMVVDGRRYGHILDPRSGWPVEGPASVTVLATRCLVAGTASTVAMLRGREAGPAWLAAEGIPHVCVDRDGGVRVAVEAPRRGRAGRSGSGSLRAQGAVREPQASEPPPSRDRARGASSRRARAPRGRRALPRS